MKALDDIFCKTWLEIMATVQRGVVHVYLIACVFKDCGALARLEDCGRKMLSRENPRLSHVIN